MATQCLSLVTLEGTIAPPFPLGSLMINQLPYRRLLLRSALTPRCPACQLRQPGPSHHQSQSLPTKLQIIFVPLAFTRHRHQRPVLRQYAVWTFLFILPRYWPRVLEPPPRKRWHAAHNGLLHLETMGKVALKASRCSIRNLRSKTIQSCPLSPRISSRTSPLSNSIPLKVFQKTRKRVRVQA